MLKRYFHKIILELDEFPEEKPVLLIANHFSWWDGFIGNYLSYTCYKKKFHVMMLREQLAKRMFLNKAGAFSIEKSSRSLIESLDYSAEILSGTDNMLMMFPQGKIESLYHRDFHFAKGVEKILQKCTVPPAIIFNINLVDYFPNPAPTLFIRTRAYPGEATAQKLEDAFNRFHRECISKQHEDQL
jgi:1-acyl-sn-glycerol-3-phosphate acyltransferase